MQLGDVLMNILKYAILIGHTVDKRYLQTSFMVNRDDIYSLMIYELSPTMQYNVLCLTESTKGSTHPTYRLVTLAWDFTLQ